MSFQAMTWAVEQDLKTNEKMALVMLSNCSNHHTGQCNPSHKRLARECGMSVSTLKRCIEKLEEGGYLKIEHRGQEGVSLPNQYHLNIGFTPEKKAKEVSSIDDSGVQDELGVGHAEPTPPVQSELGVGSERATKQESKQEYINQEDNLSDAEESAPVASEPSLPALLPKQQQGDQKETEFQAKCREAWTTYSNAYFARYKTKPIRNAKVNSQNRQLVQRLGVEAGPVAEFYVLNVNSRYVIENSHDIGTLLSKAESYRTQWATGHSMTQARAQQIDSTQTNANAAHEAIAMLRAREGARP